MRLRLLPLLVAGCLGALPGCGARDDAPARPAALVLLSVDTLRADHLGAYGSDRGLTPRLDAWAEESLVFDAAYAPAPLTVPSLVSLHTGRHPLELGFQINNSELDAEVDTLAERLAAAGWKTAAVVSNVVLRSRPDLAQGFEIYDDTMLQRESVRRWPERIAADTTDAALRILDLWQRDASVSGAPLFLWVHYQDPHGPYTPPRGFRERHLDMERTRDDRRLPQGADSHGAGGIPRYQRIGDHDEVAFYRAGYDGEIAYFDREIGRLLDALDERGLASHVVFFADHGEALGENDLWFAHGNDLTDALVRVPLFLRLPGAEPGRRTDVVRLADLHRTLLVSAASPPPGEGDAAPPHGPRDLLAPGADSEDSVPLLSTLEVYPHRRIGIVADGYKLILTQRDGVWAPRLFRLGEEGIDLAAPAPQIASGLRDRLWTLWAARRAEPAPILQVSEEERRHLEALGYVAEPVE